MTKIEKNRAVLNFLFDFFEEMHFFAQLNF
jgi:hypothetical protein